MPNKDLIVIGTSTGGFEALRALAGGLPPDLAAEHGQGQAAAALEQKARGAQRRADLVRQAVMPHETLGNGEGVQSGQKP